MKFLFRAIPALALALAACDSAAKSSADPNEALAAAEAAVEQRLPIMGTATQSGNLDALLDLWAPDVRLYESGVVMDGEEQARQIMAQFLGALNVSNLTLTPIETVAHDGGSVVYQFGSLTQTLKPAQGGPDIPVRSNFALRWVPNASGVWEMHRYVSTSAPADAAPLPVIEPSRSAVPATVNAEAEAQVAQRTGEYQDALRSGDAARIAAFFTDDAQLSEPELQQVGKAAIQAFMTEITAAYTVDASVMEPVETFVHDNGSVVYQYGRYSEDIVERATSKRTTMRNNYLIRWRRDANGTWAMDRFISTAQPDPARQY